ncbi:hypothetical protein EJ07DRAFT_184413 [Lizonia empirigonia]|nr:hypothetical protein EJ07DRAFT_184413 [Lizonia empirigonia]
MSGKRANVFGQGRPENPYEERHGPAETPQRATAAQLAARKIKAVKPRRAAGTASSGLSQSMSFGGAQAQPSFSFGASAPIGENGSAGMFGAGNAFGGAATSSFPPAQPSSSSNAFTSNSFPAPGFGAANQSAAFQPPTAAGFDFSPASSANNPFGGLNGGVANTNGNAASTAFGGAVFGSQPPSNPFGGAQNNASSASASTSLFGTANGASTPTFSFGGTSSSAAAPSTPAPASQPTFSFGAHSSSTLGANSTSTPAAASTPSFQFGATASAAPASTSTPAPTSSIFSFSGPAQKSEGSQNSATPQKNMFGFGAAATPKPAEAATPAPNVFGGASTPKPAEAATTNVFGSASTPKPAETTTTNVFGGASTPKPAETTTTNMFGSASTPAPAPASNLFSGLQTSTSSSTPKFSFGQTQETPKPQEPTPATPSFFNSVKPTDQATSATPEAPKDSLFAGLAKPASTPAPDFSSMFGASQKDSAPKESEKPPMFQAPDAPKTNMFSGFSTPQPAKTTDKAQAKAGMFSAQPKASSGFSFPSFGANSTQDAFKAPESQPAFTPPAQQSPTKEASNPFASLPGASSGSSLFNPPKPSTEPSPTLDTAVAPQLPKIGKLSVPKDWAVQDITAPQNADGLVDYVVELSLQLQAMNLKYREMIGNASLVADWSLLSIWHHQQSRSIKTKIDNAKKQRAAAKGVTGTESALSKRRGIEDGSDVQESSSKRSRPAEPRTPTPKSSTPSSTPKVNPPATATSNLFSKAIGNKSSTPEKSAPSTGFTPSFSASAGPSAPKPSGFTPSFSASAGPSAPKPSGFTPSFSASTGSSAPKDSNASGFTPSFEATKTSTGFTPSFGAPKAAVGGFTPSFGGSGNTDFTAQFAQKAKTYEQLAAERKKKAKDADYDSDDETEEEWSARYDKEEAERLAKEKETIASAGGFSLPASTNAPGSTTPTPTTEPAKETPKPAANLFANLAKPTSGVSTPSLFTPRAASPAASTTGGRSVFDSPSAAPSPASNLFGHLSSGPSSNNQDDSDDEDEHAQNDQAVGSTGSTSPKRKFGGSETESDDATSTKQATGTKGSLLSRMTRADDADSEAEKENDKPASIFGQTNGTSTPTNKPFAFFNFDNAGANTAPPKASTFAGDQTFKVGSPIKFGAPATEKKKDAPSFQFQPATPSPAEFSTTPAKPPPAGSLFSFGGSNGASLLAPNFGASRARRLGRRTRSARPNRPLGPHPEETASNSIIFHTDLALAKQQVDHGDGAKKWENFARGPLWILKDKTTAKCFVRMRIPSGATPLNYQILPALRASVTGSSGKMVQATRPGKDKGLVPVYFAVRAREVAEEFARVYNESIPSS